MTTDPGTDLAAAEPDGTEPTRAPERSSLRRQLPALLALGGVALLLIGVAIGLVIASGDDATDARPASDSAAVGFAQDMSTHHSQGVEMATIALNGSTDTEVRSLAYDILTQQTNQIGQMQSWLLRWGYPLDNPNTAMSWMAGHDHTAGTAMNGQMSGGSMVAGDGVTTPLMPGMATSSEMARLRSLRGSALDLDFLQLMLRHHRGGLQMMTYAADESHVSQDYVRTLAQQMVTIQTAEADTLAAMIAARGGTQLPMN